MLYDEENFICIYNSGSDSFFWLPPYFLFCFRNKWPRLSWLGRNSESKNLYPASAVRSAKAKKKGKPYIQGGQNILIIFGIKMGYHYFRTIYP